MARRIQRRGGTATIYDIAELAGVSPSTVSRALSTPGRISAKTESRVQAAAAQLNFRVSPIARALHTGRSQTLALVVADITNPVVFGIVRGAEHAASDAGYTLVIAESQESGEREAKAIERLLPSVDGVILATTRLSDDRIAMIAERKSTVVINRVVEGVDNVLPDMATGIDQLLDHLVALGHTHAIYVAGPENSWMSRRRADHLRETAAARGLMLSLSGPTDPTTDGGHAAVAAILESSATAVIAFNDLIAIGIIQAARESGIEVPGQLSVTGFDDIFGSDFFMPPLTTVRSPLVAAGQWAVRSTLRRLDESAGDPVERPHLATELIVRGSTGPRP